jgi:hypothetical protein
VYLVNPAPDPLLNTAPELCNNTRPDRWNNATSHKPRPEEIPARMIKTHIRHTVWIRDNARPQVDDSDPVVGLDPPLVRRIFRQEDPAQIRHTSPCLACIQTTSAGLLTYAIQSSNDRHLPEIRHPINLPLNGCSVPVCRMSTQPEVWLNA